ncbi:Bardet-Biedl syndrome 1 protein homolog isoform X1 [Bicyclus anynana]|uniref:Bardet-Biedl syndrome 1 protein homolog isoform X1 n=1 Tax=Bicyclus anynana TaxID=110368 RepID=A0ABM3LF30_BICAN|nr:Bardet-Biedl syndrome 1 protein homolog isoform X1 [Bicyclus anynana]
MGGMSRWLDVEAGNDDIDINTLPSNIALVDLQNDNEFKLVIGDLGRGDEGPRLKIFKGAMQISDLELPDLPLGVVSLYTSETLPRSTPLIAVGFSMGVYVYRNFKLFYKYYLPTVELNTSEMEVWRQLTNPENHKEETIIALSETLHNMPQKVLSIQSRDFLSLTLEQQLEFLENATDLPKKRHREVACITTMRMNSVDRYSVSCLIVGTEDGEIIVLDPQTFTQIYLVKLCTVKKTPFQMVATGLYNVDYRITVATREKCVCLLKRDWKEGRLLFNTDEHIVAIEVLTTDNSVMVICTDNTLACYSRKGKKQWLVSLEQRAVALTLLPVLQLGATLVAVALASGHVHLYDGKATRDTIFLRDVVSVMKFGQLGQEEHVFIIITSNGNLMLKILKRTADFNPHAAGIEPTASAAAQKPWLIPKKSKLFLEQSARERENAIAMHESFQLELNRLRLVAARTLLEAHTKSDNFVGAGVMEPIRLSAEVEGLGPVFRVTLVVENTSAEKAVIGLAVLFHVHSTHYKVYNPYIKVPLLGPGNQIKFPTKIEEIFSDNINPDVFFRNVTGQAGEGSLIKVLLLKDGRSYPVLAATVTMPPTDPLMIPYDKIKTSDFGTVD